MSFRPEVRTEVSGPFYSNALRFATYEEAYANASNLASRWLLVREFRAVESPEPVNYAWVNGQLVAVPPPAPESPQ